MSLSKHQSSDTDSPSTNPKRRRLHSPSFLSFHLQILSALEGTIDASTIDSIRSFLQERPQLVAAKQQDESCAEIAASASQEPPPVSSSTPSPRRGHPSPILFSAASHRSTTNQSFSIIARLLKKQSSAAAAALRELSEPYQELLETARERLADLAELELEQAPAPMTLEELLTTTNVNQESTMASITCRKRLWTMLMEDLQQIL